MGASGGREGRRSAANSGEYLEFLEELKEADHAGETVRTGAIRGGGDRVLLRITACARSNGPETRDRDQRVPKYYARGRVSSPASFSPLDRVNARKQAVLCW